jgi:hypothetical protein
MVFVEERFDRVLGLVRMVHGRADQSDVISVNDVRDGSEVRVREGVGVGGRIVRERCDCPKRIRAVRQIMVR